MDQRHDRSAAPPRQADEFSLASRRSEQEAVRAINATSPDAAAAHARLAALHAMRALRALARAGDGVAGEQPSVAGPGAYLRRAVPLAFPVAG